MTRSEIAFITQIPVPCGNCGNEEFEIAARLVDLTEYACPRCGVLLDLDTDEWAAFRNSVKEFGVGKFAPIAPVKKLP